MKPDNSYTDREYGRFRLENIDVLDYYIHCVEDNQCKNRAAMQKWLRKIAELDQRLWYGMAKAEEAHAYAALKVLRERWEKSKLAAAIITTRLEETK